MIYTEDKKPPVSSELRKKIKAFYNHKINPITGMKGDAYLLRKEKFNNPYTFNKVNTNGFRSMIV